MDEVVHILSGLTCFGFANATLFLAAYRLATRLDLSLVDKASALITFFVSQVAFSLLVCAGLGHLEKLYVLLVSLFVAIVVFSLVPKGKPFIRELCAVVFDCFRKEPSLLFALSPVVAFYLALYTTAIFSPPLGYDPLNYHLTIAATAIQRHDLSPVFFPRFFHLYAYFPENALLFSIWIMLLVGCDLLLSFVNAPFLLLWLFSVYKIARHIHISRHLSLLLSSTTLTFPMMAHLATEAYAEPVLWACFFGAIRFALLGTKGFVPAMLLCGILFGTKITSIPLSLLVIFVGICAFFQPVMQVLKT